MTLFQYRKRYGLHAIEGKRRFAGGNFEEVSIPQAVWIACNSRILRSLRAWISRFQYRKRYGLHAINALTLWHLGRVSFQYRKRYGLHAIFDIIRINHDLSSFNTASGMDCMQFLIWKESVLYEQVSIPQAVWIACNTVPHSPWDSWTQKRVF